MLPLQFGGWLSRRLPWRLHLLLLRHELLFLRRLYNVQAHTAADATAHVQLLADDGHVRP